MHLKRLELQGFKSFSEKIKLDFNKGITAVVGPNGSGKSNISDAVRWVLGEQSPKMLRGMKMEDIIFAGTENRKPLGFAEVSMTIDNSDRKLNIDFSEIRINRKVYRSGESEFSINGTNCRLKDIHQMFMDTGIGKEGYSIIGQGKIEEILSARSEDRRLLFEEAAGIVRYKNRKQEALNKIEKERQNLVRISDIISELELQLEPLHKQAEKAKQYLNLKEKHKLFQINLFLISVKEMEKEIFKVEENAANITIQIEEEKLKKANLEDEVNKYREQFATTENDIKDKAQILAETRSALEQNENDIKFITEQTNHIKSEVIRLKEEIEKKQSTIYGITDNIGLEKVKYDGLSLEISSSKNSLENMQKEFDTLNNLLNQNEEKIDIFNGEIIEKLKEGSEIKGHITRVLNLCEQLENRKEQLDNEKSLLNIQIKEKSVKLQGLEVKLIELNDMEKVIIDNQNNLEKELKDITDIIESEKGKRVKLNIKFDEATSHFKILNELEKSYEGYYRSVKALLLEKKEKPSQFSQILGAVGELLETDAKYETAIEIALGSSLQHIVTKDEEGAKEGIEYLKRTGSGRATFLPLTAIKPRHIDNEGAKILKEQGVIGIGKDLIKFDSKFENIFSNLLGRVVVVNNMDVAVLLYKKYNYAYKIVTLNGELLNVGGAITGGSINQKSSNFFSRARELKELKENIEIYGLEKEEIFKRLEAFKEQHQAIIQQFEKNKASLHKKDIERVTLRQDSLSVKNIQEGNKEKLYVIELEESQLIEQIAEVNLESVSLQEKSALIDENIKNIEEKVLHFQSSLQVHKETKDFHIQELTELKVNIGTLEQNLNEISNNFKRMENESRIHTEEIENFQSEIDIKEHSILEKQNAVKILEEEFLSLKKQQEENNILLQEFYDAKDSIFVKLQKMEEDGQAIAEILAKINAEAARLEMKNQQLKDDRRKMFDDMWDDYGLTYQSAKEHRQIEMTLGQLKSKEREIKAEIQDMGNINVGAIEEFKSVSERYGTMSKQRHDILEAEEKLKQMIDELVALMETQFKEQFKIISENFNSVFKEMFGGGKAYLRLADETKWLDSGIDIIAQPPGKTLQNMSLLSGGERALTATSLLFGILHMKPSPFCILDEVEAALDDANVTRYANFLKNFSKDTQFILITHRKGTMEVADVLYGVTMQEQGVSKLVSVDFTQGVYDEKNKEL